jgi:hypothetical protein
MNMVAIQFHKKQKPHPEGEAEAASDSSRGR